MNCSLSVFSLKETLALLKQYTAKQKMISENIITDTVKRAFKKLLEDCVLRSQEKWSKYQQFSIFMDDNTEYLQVLVVQRRFCQLQTNSLVMAPLYIYKLKINVPTMYHAPTVSCVNLRSQSFVFVLISCHSRFKTSSLHMSWDYQNSLTRAPVIKIHVILDFFQQADYILIMTFSLVNGAFSAFRWWNFIEKSE